MTCIKKIKIDNTIYEASTDYRTAIQCNAISNDKTIGDLERALGILYMVFGESGLENTQHYQKLLNWVLNWLSLGKEINNNDDEIDMDYIEDMEYIEASFMSDYGIDLENNNDMEWSKFYKLMNGLSNSEFGNCCVLNRIRNLRNFDINTISDNKERQKMAKIKEQIALKKNKKENHLTKEQEESMAKLNEILGW